MPGSTNDHDLFFAGAHLGFGGATNLLLTVFALLALLAAALLDFDASQLKVRRVGCDQNTC